MDAVLVAGLFGLLGGVTRAVVGLLKWYAPKKRSEFRPVRLAVTIVGAGIIGMFASVLVSTDFKLSLLAGYAGTDFIEGLYKARLKAVMK